MASTCTEVLTRKPQNIAVHTNEKHELSVIDADIQQPGPNDCLVHVRATGICGSDVHFWKEGKIGSSVICGSQGLGHESAGEIVKIGENVKGLQVGKLIVHFLALLLQKSSLHFSHVHNRR